MEFLKDFELGEIVYIFNRVKNFDGPIHRELITPGVESTNCGLLSLSLLSLCLDSSMKLLIASVISLRDPPFLFFLAELAVWDGSFLACLLPCPSTGVGSSSMLSPLSTSTFMCTPCVRKAASSFRSSSLLGAGWEEEICRIPVAVPTLNSCPSRS